ncbi:Ig-like domain-containing protein [Roseisolibacter agri]|uniref:BIG2 domain-containing protein n=1 Tax=Roseisolibacter agri TaxID=2014610 RepID=A0AA37QCN7_9BACT|nr:Ig-like domain-containing protein [Roseisolibacter agri]GLC27316.1 hypothetical protein rosag_38290 [Roseisolibacter agri]
MAELAGNDCGLGENTRGRPPACASMRTMTTGGRYAGRARRIVTALVLATACGGSDDATGRLPSGPDAGPTPASVTIAPRTVATIAGRSTALVAVVRDARGVVMLAARPTWTSSDPLIADVDGSGVLRGVEAGTVLVRATAGRATDSVYVTVARAPVASVTIVAPVDRVVAGETLSLQANVLDDRGVRVTDRSVMWTSSDTTLARVSADGVVAGVRPGTSTISAEVEGRTAHLPLTVAPAPVAAVRITTAATALTVGERITLIATPLDARGAPLTGRSVVWRSSDESVATVSATGDVLAIGPGRTMISASADGASSSVAVDVSSLPPATVRVSAPTAPLLVGSTVHVRATVLDARREEVAGVAIAWSSSNAAVAAVSPTGVVTGVAEGRATVTAAVAGVRGSADIVVVPRGARSQVDLPDDVPAPQFHVLYVLPSDAVDRAYDTTGTIATTIASMQNWLAMQTGGRRLRMDTYQGRLNVSFARLARTNAQLRAFTVAMHDSIAAELAARGFRDPNKRYVVYFDGSHPTNCAEASWPPTVPGQTATLYLRGKSDVPSGCGTTAFAPTPTTPAGYLEFLVLHEMLHTLGAVSREAPDHVYWAHVDYDARDLMFSGSRPWTPSMLDANRRNYYNPAGLPAGVFNLATSPFLMP